MAVHPLRVAAPRRALALIRVSKDRDGLTSPEVQRHAIEAHAAANGIDIVDWVEGIDESGSRARSAWWPRLDQAIARMEQREFNTIIVWKYSRTARNRLKWATALDRVDALGGAIISVTEPIDTETASGKFARGMLGELSAYQADLISESWKEAHDRRLRDGKPATGRARFGYTRDRDADTYEINPSEAPAVIELFTKVIGGYGMAWLTRWLNDSGHRTSRGNLWYPRNLRKYMDHGFPAGLIYANGTLHPGAHEPIIDRETWEAYLAVRATAVASPRGAARMASGLLRCTCGGGMMASRTTGGDSTYACARRSRGDDSCTVRSSIGRHLVEQYVTEWVACLPAKIDVLIEAERRHREQRARSIEDRDAIERRIGRTEQRLATLTMRLVDEKVSQQAYDVASVKLEVELRDLRARHLRAAPAPSASSWAHIPAMAEGFPQLSPPAQNQVLRSIVRRINIAPTARMGPGTWRERIDVVPKWAPDN